MATLLLRVIAIGGVWLYVSSCDKCKRPVSINFWRESLIFTKNSGPLATHGKRLRRDTYCTFSVFL